MFQRSIFPEGEGKGCHFRTREAFSEICSREPSENMVLDFSTLDVVEKTSVFFVIFVLRQTGTNEA